MKNYDKPAQSDSALRDSADLIFPDWSGMQPHRSRMTFEQAVRWNDEMLAAFPPRRLSPRLEAERRCDVEFIL